MKKHQLFFDKYHQISNPSEQMSFMRGYMLNLTPKQLITFFSVNTKNGINSIRELSLGDIEDKENAIEMIGQISNLLEELKHIELAVRA